MTGTLKLPGEAWKIFSKAEKISSRLKEKNGWFHFYHFSAQEKMIFRPDFSKKIEETPVQRASSIFLIQR